MKSRVDAATARVTGIAAGETRRHPIVASTLSPRLLDVRGAASYLGVSTWTVRDWTIAGHLIPVELPPLRPREGDRRKLRLRRLLFDRAVLDQFLDGLSGASR